MSARPLRDVFGVVCSTVNLHRAAARGRRLSWLERVVRVVAGGARRGVASGAVGRLVPAWSIRVVQGVGSVM